MPCVCDTFHGESLLWLKDMNEKTDNFEQSYRISKIKSIKFPVNFWRRRGVSDEAPVTKGFL